MAAATFEFESWGKLRAIVRIRIPVYLLLLLTIIHPAVSPGLNGPQSHIPSPGWDYPRGTAGPTRLSWIRAYISRGAWCLKDRALGIVTA